MVYYLMFIMLYSFTTELTLSI